MSILTIVVATHTVRWTGRDHLRDMPWRGIFKNDDTFAAKEI